MAEVQRRIMSRSSAWASRSITTTTSAGPPSTATGSTGRSATRSQPDIASGAGVPSPSTRTGTAVSSVAVWLR